MGTTYYAGDFSSDRRRYGVCHAPGFAEPRGVDNGHRVLLESRRWLDYRKGVTLEFIRLGRPVEKGFIESFNGRLRDECLNTHLFWSIEDAYEKIEA